MYICTYTYYTVLCTMLYYTIYLYMYVCTYTHLKGIGETKSKVPIGMVTVKLKDLRRFKDLSGVIGHRTQFAFDVVCGVCTGQSSKNYWMQC